MTGREAPLKYGCLTHDLQTTAELKTTRPNFSASLHAPLPTDWWLRLIHDAFQLIATEPPPMALMSFSMVATVGLP